MLGLLPVVKGAVLMEVVGQMVDVVIGGRRRIRRGRVDFGIDGLIQGAVGELVVRVDELLGAGRGGIEGVVVVLVGLRGRRVLGHLGEHPVVDSGLRVSAVAGIPRREDEVGHHRRGHDGSSDGASRRGGVGVEREQRVQRVRWTRRGW